MQRQDKAPLPLSAVAAQVWALNEIGNGRPSKARARRAGWQGVVSLLRRGFHAVVRRPHPRRGLIGG